VGRPRDHSAEFARISDEFDPESSTVLFETESPRVSIPNEFAHHARFRPGKPLKPRKPIRRYFPKKLNLKETPPHFFLQLVKKFTKA
jgi:hypothetical protein